MVMLGFQPSVDQKLEEALKFAKANNFDHIEILMDHPYYHYESLNSAAVLELKGIYDVEIIIHASAVYTNFLSVSSVMRRASYEELEKTLKFAEEIDSPLVTIHLGWNPGFITSRGFIFKEEWYEKTNERALEELKRFLMDKEIVAIENTISVKGVIERKLKEIFEETDAKITLDIGHYNVKEGHGLFLEYEEKIANIHLHDNRGEYDEHLPLGEGSIDFKAFIPKNYKGYLTLELRDEDGILTSKKILEEVLG